MIALASALAPLVICLFAGALFLMRSPAAAAYVWIFVIALTPPWIYPTLAGIRLPMAALISLLVVLANVNRLPRLHRIDLCVGAMALVAVAATRVAETPLHIGVQVFAEWGLCYWAGRVLARDAELVTAVKFCGILLASLAVLQFLFGFNLSELPIYNQATGSEFWMGLQERAGSVRAEVTFGHSIALGGTLALFVAFLFATGEARKHPVMIVVLTAGTLATLSRGANVGCIVAFAGAIAFGRAQKGTKFLGLAALTATALVVWQTFDSRVSQGAYGQEVSDSTQYREDLLELVGILRPIGIAPGGILAEDGSTYRWSGFYSIDNALLYVGLYAGWVAAVLFAIPVMWLLWRLVRQAGDRRLSLLAMSQVPLILTVAPITQYQNYFWLFVGVMITRVALSAEADQDHFHPATRSERL